jgi:enoyl-CoA hydratase/carnithine racemase
MNATDDIVTERSEGILRVELNRPEKLNALTSSMYTKLADVFNDAPRTSAYVSCFGTVQEMLSAPATM